jgi:hypothetical protein
MDAAFRNRKRAILEVRGVSRDETSYHLSEAPPPRFLLLEGGLKEALDNLPTDRWIIGSNNLKAAAIRLGHTGNHGPARIRS